MMQWFINGEEIITIDAFHECIADYSDLGASYGRNLDALWDILTTYQDVSLLFYNPLFFLTDDPEGALQIFSLLWEAEKENPTLHIYIGAERNPLLNLTSV